MSLDCPCLQYRSPLFRSDILILNLHIYIQIECSAPCDCCCYTWKIKKQEKQTSMKNAIKKGDEGLIIRHRTEFLCHFLHGGEKEHGIEMIWKRRDWLKDSILKIKCFSNKNEKFQRPLIEHIRKKNITSMFTKPQH